MKQRIKLTEADLHRIVKESVDMVINEVKPENEPMTDDNQYDLLHGSYPRHTFQQYRDEASGTFDEWIDKLEQVYALFVTDWPRGVTSPIEAAKQFGYTKSYKRLLLAKKYIQKTRSLLRAVKQDMCAEYVNKDYTKKIKGASSYGYEGSGFSSNGIGYY